MTILNRYLLRRNLFLLFALLSIGAGVYILSDLFQRIDVFLDSGKGFGIIGFYYLNRLPLIISQILPAVFLLSMVLQLLIMAKNRESIALQSGGVSPAAMIRFVLIYGLIWSCFHFAFSQVLGVYGQRVSDGLWQEDVRGRDPKNRMLEGLLFTQGNYVVQTGKAWPQTERAENIHIYKFNDAGTDILASYLAASAESGPRGWKLHNVQVIEPPTYSFNSYQELELDILQDLATFRNYDTQKSTKDIEISQLVSTIQRLELAGTNVEGLRTELHSRFSYAGSILVMGLIALALTIRTSSIYLGVILSLVATFLFYAVNSLFSTMGQSGALVPPLAAWMGNMIFAAIALLYIFSQYLRSIFKKI